MKIEKWKKLNIRSEPWGFATVGDEGRRYGQQPAAKSNNQWRRRRREAIENVLGVN